MCALSLFLSNLLNDFQHVLFHVQFIFVASKLCTTYTTHHIYTKINKQTHRNSYYMVWNKCHTVCNIFRFMLFSMLHLCSLFLLHIGQYTSYLYILLSSFGYFCISIELKLLRKLLPLYTYTYGTYTFMSWNIFLLLSLYIRFYNILSRECMFVYFFLGWWRWWQRPQWRWQQCCMYVCVCAR